MIIFAVANWTSVYRQIAVSYWPLVLKYCLPAISLPKLACRDHDDAQSASVITAEIVGNQRFERHNTVKQSIIWQSILTFTGPLAETTHIKVPPHWRAVCSSYIGMYYYSSTEASSRSNSNTSAGTDTYGNVLNLASAVVDGQQVIGHSTYQADFSYPSLKGGKSKSDSYAILDNLNYYK